ncbi:MAG: carbohydrate binding domain-containing protein [Flavobacteriales bacterium]|nr:carbohydrate binding domain-containing protein [Flavobacteriales bacterium]
MRKVLLSFVLLAATAASAQFTSGFENWPDTVPSDWMGTKTTLNADSVIQVSTDVHGGTYAVRLQNSTTSHKRFTTQPVTVTTGTIYTISFWVRGQGNIRTGLFDNRPTGSGYATYNAYYNSTGNTWTEVTQQIAAAMDYNSAEFILSVQSTGGAEHLVVDDVNIVGGGAPVDASIYGIQYTVDASGNSPLAGQIVNTGGIVTAVDTIGANSYFIQNGTGPWNGIYVNDATNAVQLGDSVIVTASVEESFTYTRLNVTSFTLVNSGNTVPAAEVLNPNQASEEQWEGMLVQVPDIGCSAAPDQFNEWFGVSTTQGQIKINDLCYVYVPTVGTYYTITGVMNYSFNERKLEPRFLADIAFGSGLAEANLAPLGLYPNPANDVIRMNLGNNGQRMEYTIVDATGRTVMSDVLTSNALNVGELVNGLYTLTIRSAEGVRQARVLVQH